MSGWVVRFGRVDRDDAPLSAVCTDVLWEPVEIRVEAAEAVSGFAEFFRSSGAGA